VEDDMTETETTKTCMVCGRPISEGEEAVPVMAEGVPLEDLRPLERRHLP
jgi:hypothetical protein